MTTATKSPKAEITKSRHDRNKEFAEKLNSALNQSATSLMDAADVAYEWRESRVWEDEFDSFPEAVCSKVRKIQKSQAYNLAVAGEVRSGSKNSTRVENLDSIKGLIELKKVEDSKARDSILEKVMKAGEVTTKAIKEAVKLFLSGEEEREDEPVTVALTDKMGLILPDEIIKDWNRAKEVSGELLSSLSHIRLTLEDGITQGDRIYSEIHQSTIIDLKSQYTSVKSLAPYAVCTCEGFQKEKCTFCNGRGFVSEFRWKQTIPQDVKTAREKTIQKQK